MVEILHAASSYMLGAIVSLSLANVASPSSAAPLTHKCGPSLRSVVKTDRNAAFRTSSTSFVNVTGARVRVRVPADQTRCVKVRFSAATACLRTACNVRVVGTGSASFEPSSDVSFAYEDDSGAQVRSFEWVKRLDPGAHTVHVQARVLNQGFGASLGIESWTLHVEIAE